MSKPASDEPQVGQVFDERFEISDIISRSGMSSVYKATDLKTGRLVALKVPHLKLESDPAFFSRFEREEEIGLSLDHPSILKIIPVDPAARADKLHCSVRGVDKRVVGAQGAARPELRQTDERLECFGTQAANPSAADCCSAADGAT